MPVRTILRYPDPQLAAKCAPVSDFDAGLQALVKDLLHTMQAAPGVGITAAHIGVLKRVSVIKLGPDEPLIVHINPEILSRSVDLQRFTEGSVSMPRITDEVERPRAIRFRYQDVEGHVHEDEADGFLSTCIQHEIDQLDGIFWLKRLSRLKRDRLVRRFEKEMRA